MKYDGDSVNLPAFAGKTGESFVKLMDNFATVVRKKALEQKYRTACKKKDEAQSLWDTHVSLEPDDAIANDLHQGEYGEHLGEESLLRYKNDFTDWNYDRHREDTLASERLSGSKHMIEIFAYYSNTRMYEYRSGGDIEGMLWP